MPWLMPPRLKLPARTMIRLVPADWIWASICCWAPVPMASRVITAAIPMIKPSIVSTVRILFRPSAFNATRKIMKKDIGFTPCAVAP